jgi:hypothetical protein
MIVNINLLLWISCLDFVTISFLDSVYMWHADILKQNHDSSPVTRWCQPSRSATYKNGNIALAYSFHFSHKSLVNRCRTQCKWNDLNQKDLCKYCNTAGYITNSLSDIEWDDSNGDLSNIAKFLLSRSSRGGLPLRISSRRLWRPRYISVIQNWTIRSW